MSTIHPFFCDSKNRYHYHSNQTDLESTPSVQFPGPNTTIIIDSALIQCYWTQAIDQGTMTVTHHSTWTSCDHGDNVISSNYSEPYFIWANTLEWLWHSGCIASNLPCLEYWWWYTMLFASRGAIRKFNCWNKNLLAGQAGCENSAERLSNYQLHVIKKL